MHIEKELVKCASCFFSQQANIGCGLWPGMAWKQRKHRFPGSCYQIYCQTQDGVMDNGGK